MPEQNGKNVRLAVLGCADVAVRRVLPALGRTDGVELVAVASRSAARAAEVTARFGGRPVTGYDAALELSDVDAVYLPLPSGLHADWIERALRAGKHVLAEKPLTTTRVETEKLLSLAHEHGLVLMENFMFTQHAQHDFVRKLVSDGVIGELRTVSSTFTMPSRPADDIRYQAELGGGSLLDNGAYPVHVARMFLGDELEVAGAVLYRPEGFEVDLGGSALLRRPSDGAAAQLTFGMAHLYKADYHLLGSAGSIEVERAFTPPEHHQPVVRVRRQSHVEEFTLPPDDQFARSVARFAAAVRAGRAPAGVDDGMVAQAGIVDEIRGCALR